MPQLSPLNWIFLFMLFWLAVIIISVMIWWASKNLVYVKQNKNLLNIKNKWIW